jgi:DNA-binding transcriptional regulator YdaS (Cro superfamily)
MLSSGMLDRVVLVRNDVSEERSSSIIRMTRISEMELRQRELAATARCKGMRLLLVTANVLP